MIKVILLATNNHMAERFEMEFAKFENVIVHRGMFEQLKGVDCLVSPGNSFGIMDGGMDKSIINYFGYALQQNVQEYIKNHFACEQPVGTAFMLTTNHSNYPYLIHTPTMRIPSDVSSSEHAYLAMRATLLEAQKNGDIKSIAIPAFCHATGRMSAARVAYQMAQAYLQVSFQPKIMDWNYAVTINNRLGGCL